MSYPYDPEVEALVPFAPVLDLAGIPAPCAMTEEQRAGIAPFEPATGVQLTHLAASGKADNPPVELFVLSPTATPAREEHTQRTPVTDDRIVTQSAREHTAPEPPSRCCHTFERN